MSEPTIVFPDAVAALTSDEAANLSRCEKIIDSGKNVFLIVGIALTEIRDKRLYRDKFNNFSEYLWQRWGYKKSHGYRMISAANLQNRFKKLSPQGDIRLPSQERAVRELLRVRDEERQVEVLQSAAKLAGEGDIQTQHVRTALKDLGYGSQMPSGKRQPRVEKGEAAILLQKLTQAVEAGVEKHKILDLIAKLSRAI